MKVLHVSTHDTGGAAEAAYRLHRALCSIGIDSRFMVLYNSGRYDDVITFTQDKKTFIIKKILRRIHSDEKVIQRELSRNKRIEIFSLHNTVYNILTHPLVKECDIVHLHWIGSFVDYGTFFKDVAKKTVWTFHDENPILGGFHYSIDIPNASSTLGALEQRFSNDKRKYLVGAAINVVTPSKWLCDEVRRSEISALQHIDVVHYGVDKREFCLVEKHLARQELNLEADKTYFLALASDLSIYRKGFDLIQEIFESFRIDFASLLVVGRCERPFSNAKVQYLGFIHDKSELSRIYSAVDATIIPSRADNLPNVMLEALVCGCPVLGFQIGGLTEVIQNFVNGILSNDVTAQGLYDVLLEFHNNKHLFHSDRIRADAIARFDHLSQAEKMASLYKTCLGMQ